MKFVYLLLAAILIIVILILYFQMLVFGEYKFPFFGTMVNNSVFTLYIIFCSLFAGVLLTLGIKGVLNNNGSIDDGFDL